jgi:hypothetical protein
MPQDLDPRGNPGITTNNATNTADTADADGAICHETPKPQTRRPPARSRLHPSPEALDALEEVLLRFPCDLLEKYILGRWAAPDRCRQRRQRDPKLIRGSR